jgi:hypothetical protein
LIEDQKNSLNIWNKLKNMKVEKEIKESLVINNQLKIK